MNLDFIKVTNSGADKHARIDLFGTIGGGFFDRGIDESSLIESMKGVSDTQPLDIYINTNGGSVFTALAMYGILCRHSGAITIHVTGIAASAGTIITSVPNAKVIMPKGSLMLIHPVRMSASGLTPEEMEEQAENLRKIRDSVIDVYAKKTKCTNEELMELMGSESMLTAYEAVEKGFADVYDEGSEISNSVGDVAMIGGLKVTMDIVSKAPEGFFKAEKSAVKNEDKEMNLEELKAEHPELVEAIRKEASAEAVTAERARIKAIEEMAVGHDELVAEAKYTNAMTPEAFAMAVLKAEKASKAEMLRKIENDAKELDGVVAEGNEGLDPKAEAKKKDEAEMEAAIKAGASAFSGK